MGFLEKLITKFTVKELSPIDKLIYDLEKINVDKLRSPHEYRYSSSEIRTPFSSIVSAIESLNKCRAQIGEGDILRELMRLDIYHITKLGEFYSPNGVIVNVRDSDECIRLLLIELLKYGSSGETDSLSDITKQRNIGLIKSGLMPFAADILAVFKERL
jgi:hypothetical protein